MKSHLWIGPKGARSALQCLLASACLAAVAFAQPTANSGPPVLSSIAASTTMRPTLAQALDAAWARSLEAAESHGQHGIAGAERRIAEAWLAGAPTLDMSQRQGRGAAAAGARETELGLQLPLWRPGQREQGSRAAQVEQDWAQASERAARLRLAGQLRELSGSMRAARADMRMAEAQTQMLQKLSLDVERRVSAGDLAPADAMAAKAEWLSAQATVVEAAQDLLALNSTWHLLTGFSSEPEAESVVDAPDGGPGSDHPALLLAQLSVERARQRVALGRAQRGAAPELGISMRQDRPGGGQSAQNSVALSLRLPLGSEPPQQTQALAAALAEQALADATAQRVRLQIEGELAVARARQQSAAAQTSAERERASLLRERARLLEHSFKLGESPLPELLRALSAARQAESAVERQVAAHALAQARFKQALGVFP